MKLWEGRFDQPTAPDADAFNESLSFDKALYRCDITASIAHATMLGACGILSKEESDKIVAGLKSILSDIEEKKLAIEGYEDIHSFVENHLVKRIGDTGKKLHTARSRNDQVATDFRLYVRESALRVKETVRSLIKALLALSEAHYDDIMPGYTHLRKAQPISVSQFFNAYAEMFLRDMDRLNHTYRSANVMPLGSGALAGTSYPIDRNLTKELLGFDSVTNCSLDGVSDRDFVAEYLFSCSLIMAHLSRLAEDTILYTTEEFGFFEISDAYSTGSSIMPQKKNPDITELVRGKTGRVYGDLMALLTVMKGLPLAYNKDMQEDKEAFFDGYDTLCKCLTTFTEMLRTTAFRADVMRESAGLGFTNATDLADYLVGKGVPFRDAHHVSGTLVAQCLREGKALTDLTIEELRRAHPAFDADVYEAISLEACVQRRSLRGGPAPSAVQNSIDRALAWRAAHADGAPV